MAILYSQKNKTIGIFGLGKTGMAAYESLKGIAKIVCYDQQESSREIFTVKYGSHDLADLLDPKWLNIDRLLLSPGIPLSHAIVKIAQSHNIPITSDIDLLFEESSPQANFIAVTGTNGKSTTTAITGHILKSNSFDYPAGGNIGIPALSMELDKNGYVLELSSFQLDLLKNFKAKIAILLNITPDHLDRHGTMEHYTEVKKKIFARMEEDSWIIINVDNDITRQIFERLTKENKVPFSTQQILDRGVSIQDNIIYDNIFEPINISLPLNKYLRGNHNSENILASYAASRIIGVAPEQIIAAISRFQGLPHRMQYIGNIQDIDFYNDSKATNSDAASKSISALDNIYWLAGGVSKESGIEELAPLFNKIKKAYLFGQDKELFAKTLKDKVDFVICEDLEMAFNLAFNDACINISLERKNILLAPTCASFDQFKSFEHRGEEFTRLYTTKL